METKELFYPEIHVSIGSYVFTRGIEIEVHTSRMTYCDWANIRFTKQFQPEISIEPETRGVIQMGYQGQWETVFEGSVEKPYDSATGMDEIMLRDDMVKLEKTFISNAFLSVEPQDIIRYGIQKAEISRQSLISKQYPVRRRVAIAHKNIIRVIHEVHHLWHIEHLFFFSGGVFYWGADPPQSKIYRFEYGVNIICLTRQSGLWELETVSVPFIRHSHTIIIDHPRIQGEFQVKKVRFITNDEGFIRTYLYF